MIKKHLTNSTETISEKNRIQTKGSIEFGFLLRLIMKVGFVLGCGVLVPAGVFWLITAHLEANTYMEVLYNINRFQLSLLQVTVLSAAGQVLLAGVLIAVIALLASHKIAGPLIRFERYVHALGEGNLRQKVTFRKGDQNISLPDTFNKLCERLRKRIKTAQNVRATLEEIRQDIGKVHTHTFSKVNMKEILNQIDEQALKLRQAGSFEIKTKDAEV